METRLSSKRKDSEREVAKLESQVLTRSAAKKAKAAGVGASLVQEPLEVSPASTVTRSRSRNRGREPAVKEEPHPPARAARHFRTAARQDPKPEDVQQELEGGAELDRGEAGPVAPRAGQAEPEETRGDQSNMDRQRRDDGDDADRAREGADGEVSCLQVPSSVPFCAPGLACCSTVGAWVTL